ncbi:MAG: hypothetical protein ACK5UE_12275 [Chitinophagales bacterium]
MNFIVRLGSETGRRRKFIGQRGLEARFLGSRTGFSADLPICPMFLGGFSRLLTSSPID